VAAFYYLSGKRAVAALEKYSLAAFNYLCGKRGVAALEKYNVTAFYYLLYFSRAATPPLPQR
jgi:hypothetical protein